MQSWFSFSLRRSSNYARRGPCRVNCILPAVLNGRALSSSSTATVDLEYDLLAPEESSAGPLIILHGLFGSKRNWTSLCKSFRRDLKRTIISLDLRNHGTSPHAEPMTYSSMAADVLHFCRKHDLTNVSVLGHSMGGKVAMAFALNPELPPDLLSHLIVADIAPSRNALSTEFQEYIRAMQKIEETGVTSRKEAHKILESSEPDMMIRSFLLTNLDTHNEQGSPLKFHVPLDIISRAIPELGSFPYEPGQRSWDGPTLFIKGKKSKYINHKNLPLAEEFFPKMELKELDSGHWVHAEKPNEFQTLVREFLVPNSGGV